MQEATLTTVLVVEDDPKFLKIYQRKLASQQLAVIATDNVKEALYKLQFDKPAVVILDIMLTGEMNGFDFLEELQKLENTQQTPVVVVSNLDNQQQDAAELNVAAYFIKAETKINDIIDTVVELVQSWTYPSTRFWDGSLQSCICLSFRTK